MARMPRTPFHEPSKRRPPDTEKVIKPEGRFIRDNRARPKSDRSPSSVTRIRPDDREPILPEMPYIPPA